MALSSRCRENDNSVEVWIAVVRSTTSNQRFKKRSKRSRHVKGGERSGGK